MVKPVALSNYIFVPYGLNLGSKLPEKEFKHLPKYFYFMDLLNRQRVFNQTYKTDDFIRLKSPYLQKIMTTKKAQSIIQDLVLWGIIEIDDKYIVGKQSKGYRFTEQCRGMPVKGVKLEDKAILKKLKAVALQPYKPTPTLEWLRSNYVDQLKVDFAAAYAFIVDRVMKGPRPFIRPFSPVFLPVLGRLRESKVLSNVSKVLCNNKEVYTPPYVITFLPPLDGIPPPKVRKKPEKTCFELFEPFQIVALAKNDRAKANREKIGKGRYERFKFSSFIKPAKTLRWFDYQRQNNSDDYQKATGREYKYLNFIYDLLTLQMLASREPHHIIFIRDDVGNRLHTNITNMSSHLRQFLSHETGEQLVNLDIRNSQPLIFATLVKDHYKGRDMPADAVRYIELTRTGKFYEDVMQICGVPQSKETRSAFKAKFFANIFYCKNQHMDNNADARKFKEYYPNVYEIIKSYKAKKFEQLSIEMQRRESKIIIDRVCKSLLDEFGEDFFCLTIHDSIVTIKSNAAIVKKRIEDIFTSEYGITPTVNREYFN